MPLRTVVLDANVLVMAALRDTLLRAADAALYRLAWSEDILAEVERTLVDKGMTTKLQARLLLDVMRAAFPDAAVTGYRARLSHMTNDPKDRHVLAAAVTAGAPVIVTANLKHFRAEALAPYAITAQSPDDFLCDLSASSPERLGQIIRAQARDLVRPPLSVPALLSLLARQQAPQFAARFSAYMMPGEE